MKNTFSSLTFKKILFAIIVLAAAFFIFGLGVSVGYHKASFSSSMRDHYYDDFYGPPPQNVFDQMRAPMPMDSHGIVGTVIDTSTSTIAVKDFSNDELSVQITSDTIIKKGGNIVSITDVDVGNRIAVIGAPNPKGQIDGRFIRIFNTSSTMPLPN